MVSPATADILLEEESKDHTFRVVQVAEGLKNPWGMAFLPSGDLLITERPGRLRLWQNGVLRNETIRGLPEIIARGQSGLLDIALHPDYEDNGWIYFSYTAGNPRYGFNTELARAQLNLRDMTLEDLETLFVADPKPSGGVHFGSRILFLEDGTLILTLGERGRPEQAQSLENHLGTVIRLREDGTVPEDNPFVSDRNAQPEIYSYGHRNTQGAARLPGSDRVWLHEHGPRGGDEVNILKAGANYGWPTITYGINYDGSIITKKTSAPDMEQPVVYWDPSIAPCGMAFYTGSVFSDWTGDLFVGALAGRQLRRLEVEGDRIIDQEILLKDKIGRVRCVLTGPDGLLYVASEGRDGRIFRLEPSE